MRGQLIRRDRNETTRLCEQELTDVVLGDSNDEREGSHRREDFLQN